MTNRASVVERGWKLHGELIQAHQDKAADTVADLLSIVERLPQTADGVPVIPGMTVFMPGCKYPGEVDFVGRDGMVFTNDCIDWDVPIDAVDRWSVRRASTLYPTRAAAEAARAGQ